MPTATSAISSPSSLLYCGVTAPGAHRSGGRMCQTLRLPRLPAIGGQRSSRAPTATDAMPARVQCLSGRVHRLRQHERNETSCQAAGEPLEQVMGIENGPAAAAFAILPLIVGLLGWKGVLYGQLEYIKAALLSNWIPKGGCVTLQSGGSTRDLYYLPADINKAICVDKDLKESLWLNAGIQVGVPVEVHDARPEQLAFQPDNSVDAVIGYYTLAAGGRGYLEEVARVLKPGCPFVFIDRVKAEGWESGTQTVLSGKQVPTRINELEALFEAVDVFDDVQCDLALPGDPHAVGVALLLGESEDEELQERRISRRRKSRSRRGSSK